jgi:DNA ligase (NAD+)
MDYKIINQNPSKFLESANLDDIEDLLLKSSDFYYNSSEGETLLSDEVFDYIKDFLEKKYPESKYLNKIGSDIKKEKVKLPIHMGSMNKKKTEKEINKWIKDYPGEVVISDKLDGISFLLVNKSNKIQILTRGNGTYGKDISEIQEYIQLPKLNTDMVVRGEILVSRNNFLKVKDNFKNARSFIAGMSNQKDFSKKKDLLKLVDFVVYEVVEPKLSPSEQFLFIKENGFKSVLNCVYSEINFVSLKDKMLLRKKESIYDIDGLIITSNNLNDRNKDGNPKYSFAFKMDLEFAITKVLGVEWNASKHGKLKPIVNIEPVLLCGTTNKKATGNNADFIIKNGIGPGAIIKLIKGGEIIPKIVAVLEKKEPQLPNVEYKWNETKKELILLNMEEDENVKIKRIVTFFKTIGVENIGHGLYKKMYINGFDTIYKIMNIKKVDLLKLDGIKEKSSQKIIKSINDIISIDLEIEKIITGTCILDSIGYKILKKITEKYPKIFGEDIEITKEKLIEIPSIQEKTAMKVLDKLDEIKDFLKNHNQLKIKKIVKDNLIDEEEILNIVITGKRDKIVKSYIDSKGWQIQTTVNKKTNILIVDSLEIKTSKMMKATELNINIMTNESFKTKYVN